MFSAIIGFVFNVFAFIFVAFAIITIVFMGLLAICIAIMILDFVLTMLINPFYYLATGKNLKNYEEYRDMPMEDDFF